MCFWIVGDICPLGAYCPAGSAAPYLCGAGSYLNSTGNDDMADCISCTPGYYCAGGGNSFPTGLCDAGYFCPGGQDAPNPPGYNCTPGHYCPEGSSAPIRCSSGTYQDELGQSGCKSCPQGYYCDRTEDPVVLYNNSACPTGFYCPQNTRRATEFPCPLGTFNNITHRTVLSDCVACLAGQFCDQTGLSWPAGDCQAGYYCTYGADSPTPTLGQQADICPEGSYCPSGSSVPQSCPPGTFNPTAGRQDVSECVNCTAGLYCPDYNMTAAGPPCQEGKFFIF